MIAVCLFFRSFSTSPVVLHCRSVTSTAPVSPLSFEQTVPPYSLHSLACPASLHGTLAAAWCEILITMPLWLKLDGR